MQNSYEAQALTNMGYVEKQCLILPRDYQNAWQMLALGRADFTYASEFFDEIFFESFDSNSPLFVKAFNRDETSTLYIAASINTDASTLLKLKQSLESMHKDGTAENYYSNPQCALIFLTR